MANPTFSPLTPPPLNDMNSWADYWRKVIGVNIIPANTRAKKTFTEWKQWQTKPIPDEVHEQWKKEGKFADGMAIILAKVWFGDHRNKYLIFVDCDNLRAIEEFCTRSGETVSLNKIAEKFIVEQHKDDRSKAHILFYSDIPFPKKSSDTNVPGLSDKIRTDEVPAFEVKGNGTHGIAYCTPSIHKDGEPYEFIGVTTPQTLSEEAAKQMVEHIDAICRKYKIKYLELLSDEGNDSYKALIPMSELYSNGFEIYQGHNRLEALLRVMESMILKMRGQPGMSLETIKTFARFWNEKHCVPPKTEDEFEECWQGALKFIAELDAEEVAKREQEGNMLDGCMVMELTNRSPETYTVVIKKDNYRNSTTGVKQHLRVILPIQIERKEVKDENGATIVKESRHYKHFVLNAIPIAPIEIIYDPLFEQTKYKIRWEYVGKNNQIIQQDEPVGPYTKEELKTYLKDKTPWVFRENLLDDTLNHIIKAYSRKPGMAHFTTEIETEGLIWIEQ
jgi:hypothetical protein